MNTVRRVLCLLIATCLLALPAAAEAPPRPERKTGDLQSLQKKLEAEQENKNALQQKLKSSEKELAQTRRTLLKTAESARANEKLIQDIEARKTALETEESALKARLESDYGSLADLILAMERMKRIPPELLIARPGAPLETAQTALLLKNIVPALNKRAATLSEDLKRLEEIRLSLEADREKLLSVREKLSREHDEVSGLMKKRETLYKSLNSDYEKSAAAIDRISKDAKSVQEFLARLQEEEKRQQQAAGTTATVLAWSMPRSGKPQLPVPGVILTGYGQTDKIGAESQGLTIESTPHSLVLTPMGGIVRYAGSFTHYGQIVILEHSQGYHSLIGGLAQIDVVVGQSLEAGEPLGKLAGASSRGGKPALYYELRYKGQPINPSEKFSDLKS